MAIRPTHGDQEGAAWNGHFACTCCLCSTGSAIRNAAQGDQYTIRLKADAILRQSIACLPTRPVGRPPDHMIRTHAGFSHQAGSWDKKRRVAARVERHPGERVPHVGFIVTRLNRPAGRVVAFCNRRGTAGQHIKEGRNAIVRTRLSCRRFRNMPCGSGFMRSPAIPVTSCGRRVCRRRSGDGRRPA